MKNVKLMTLKKPLMGGEPSYPHCPARICVDSYAYACPIKPINLSTGVPLTHTTPCPQQPSTLPGHPSSHAYAWIHRHMRGPPLPPFTLHTPSPSTPRRPCYA
ncbi:hypothetical protein PIB30_055162 [Stylosanthes scabra]|uniref:Uncharacterized protein n=1 Tax=Stylosanthes scabra TaxID=79078 RepID=A0ABU6TIS8_9FABA|nr:hypothetical protein [Stylosanthes scabra]